ncbi:MAG: hypothetical protein KC503_36765, partial [Myxococcales bacterium]|nr:hypothetical protein [Myxococcales bacterium]
MSKGERRALVGALAVLGALGVFVALRFSITNDIVSFLPGDSDRELLELSRKLAGGDLSRTMILTIGAKDAEQAAAASRALEAALRSEPRVGPRLERLEGGPAVGFE